MPHRLDDRQVHQPDFLEDNPITKIPDYRLSQNLGSSLVPGHQKMREGIPAQLCFQHFARPGCREASFFYP